MNLFLVTCEEFTRPNTHQLIHERGCPVTQRTFMLLMVNKNGVEKEAVEFMLTGAGGGGWHSGFMFEAKDAVSDIGCC